MRLASSSDVHAILICGNEGAFPMRYAQMVASRWLCEAPTSEGPCGSCNSCSSAERGTHPDMQVYAPMGAGNFIRLGQIQRDDAFKDNPNVPIIEFLRTPPLKSSVKVVVVKEADRMNANAANALLKTLEEPPSYAKFVLATTVPSKVLMTIRSRCLNVVMPDEELGEGLRARVPHLAEFLEKGDTEAKILELCHAMMRSPKYAALQLAEQVSALASSFGNKDDGSRIQMGRTLEVLAAAVAELYPERQDAVLAICEAHRHILGNGQANLALDSLMVKVL
jgi:hypothetical protein